MSNEHLTPEQAAALGLPRIIWAHEHLRVVAHLDEEDGTIRRTPERREGWSLMGESRWTHFESAHDWIALSNALMAQLPLEPGSRDASPDTSTPTSAREKRRADLRRDIDYHRYRYHTLDDPTISDFHYDAMVRELRALDAEAVAQEPSSAALVTAKEQLLDAACDLVLLQKALHKLIGAIAGHTSDAAARDEALRRLQSARAGLEEAGRTLGLGSLYRASEDAVERAGAESAQDADRDLSAHHPWDEPF